MGFLQLLASLWPFLKEMFIGEKIKDSVASKDGANGKAQNDKKDDSAPVNVARWSLDKMQKSRRFLASVLVLLFLSLFINYKVIGKLSPAMLARKEDDQSHGQVSPLNEPKEVPTVPRKDSSERDVSFEHAVRELKNLYGYSR